MKLHKIASASRMGVTVAYHWMHYMFAENRDKIVYKNCSNIDDITKMLLTDAASLYEIEDEFCCVENPQLLGFLCALGYDEAISSFLMDSQIDYKRQYEMFFDLLENNVENQDVKDLIHNAYCEFGPMAHLTWWKQNLGCYKFVGTNAKVIEQSVQSIVLNPNADLASQRSELSKIEQSYTDFKKYFKVNYLLGLSGIRRITGKDYIYSGKLSCLLAYHFLNQEAPLGYKYSLKI